MLSKSLRKKPSAFPCWALEEWMAAGQIAEPRLTRLRVSFTRSYQRATVHLRNGCAEFDRRSGERWSSATGRLARVGADRSRQNEWFHTRNTKPDGAK